jgi:1-phosphofructokinase family hexose kinase
MIPGQKLHPILCVGLTPALQELYLLDRFEPGEVNRLPRPLVSSAGKGVNVAHALATLGSPSVLIGFLGGATGNFIRQELTGLGVTCRLVRVPLPTRTCRTLKEKRTGRVTELVEEAVAPTAADWRKLFQGYQSQLRRARLVIIAGALMPGAPARIYHKLAAAARRARVPLLIDSQREPLRETLGAQPFLAKLNVAELENTIRGQFPTEKTVLAAARQLLAYGAEWALVTHGADGAWLVGAEQAWHYRPPTIKAVNPIGSGDAVTAGIAHALADNEPLPRAVRHGIACGTANALTAKPAVFHLRDVRRLEKQIVVRLI